MNAADFNRYPPREIAAILRDNAPREDNNYLRKPGDMYFDSAMAAAIVVVSCGGTTRAISEEKRKFLELYFSTARGKPEWGSLFLEETLCKEGSAEYWMPIQQNLVSAYRSEVKDGEATGLFVAYLGSYRPSASTALENVIVINEFLTKSQVSRIQ